MKKYGLIGKTLGHSFSQRYFTDKFKAEDIDARYDNYELPDISKLITLIASTPHLEGLNVTIPYKQAVLPMLNSLSDDAREIGAVNVIRISDMRGFNTDAIGFSQSIRPLLRTHHKAALVLGTGGASRAVCHALRQMSIMPQLVSRTPQDDNIIRYSDIDLDTIQQHTVVVNCTPLGTYPHIDTCPPLPYHMLTSRHLLFDLVYNPSETTFMRYGRMQGATTKNGYEMLVLQAEAAWQIWNSKNI